MRPERLHAGPEAAIRLDPGEYAVSLAIVDDSGVRGEAWVSIEVVAQPEDYRQHLPLIVR